MPRMTERKWNFALLGNRIAYALEKCELGPAEIARRVGVSRPAVDQWLKGDTKNLKMANLFRLTAPAPTRPEAQATLVALRIMPAANAAPLITDE